MSPRRRSLRVALPLAAVLALPACAGQPAYEQCVEHSVEEGVAQDRAEQACAAAHLEDGS